MKKPLKPFLSLSLSLFLSLSLSLSLLPSCQKAVIEETPAYGGQLIIGDYYPIDIINPIVTSSGISIGIYYLVFNGLVKPDEHFNIVPDLAHKWGRSEDGLRWKFFLREGVKFHDGRELTSEDVKFTYDLIKDPKYRGYYTQFFEPIDRINIIDRYTIEIVLKQPYAPLLSGLIVGILPEHIYSGKNLYGAMVNKHPIGTGPFKILSYSPNETVLEANKEYFDERPYLDKVIFKIFKNQKTLFAKMMDGTIDTIVDVNPENIDILKQVTYFKAYKFLKPFYYILAFQNRGIFEDRKVRLALNYAVNKKKLLKNVLNSDGKIASGSVFPESWAYNQQIKPYPYDPQKALDLLHEAGWVDSNNNHILDKDGHEFDFTILLQKGDAIQEKNLRQIQVDLIQLGISTKTKKLSIKEYNNYLMKRKFDAIIIAMVSRGDPDNNYKFWHSSQIINEKNFFSYKNKKIDNFLEKGRRVFDIDLRKKFYYQFQEEMFKDPPGIFLFWANNLFMVHERFKGAKMHPSWMFDLKDWYVPKEKQRG